jgi:two-component system, cell cycle sensor histidine kinase and response regulator CckA
MDSQGLQDKDLRHNAADTLRHAKRQFAVLTFLLIFLNILIQYLFSLFLSPRPLLNSVLETAAVSLLVLPVGYFYWLRPLRISLARRTADVVERLDAQTALKESNELFALFMRHSPIFAFIKEVRQGQSRVLQASENYYEMIGIPGSLMNGRTMEELFPPEFAAKMTADDCAVVSDGSVLRQEEELNGRTYTTIKFPIVQGGKRLLAGYTIDISERKQIENALRESEQKYKTLHESAGLGIAYYSTDAVAISYNRVAAANLDGLPEDFNGKSIDEILPPEEAQFYRKRIEKAITADAPITYEDTIELPSGSKAFLSTFTRILNADNSVSGVQVISQEITERKNAEEALRASEQLIEGMLNAIPACVFWKDRDLVFLGCNKAFARDAGFDDATDVIGKNDFQMSWKDQAEAYRANDNEVINGGCAKLLIEEPHTSASGDVLTVLTSKVPLRGASGEITGVLGTYMDITAHRNAEEALRQNEEKLKASEGKYRKLIESAPEAIYVIEDEKVVFANGNAMEMLGYTREELLGMPMEAINHPDDWGEALKRYRERAKGRSLAESVTRHVTKTGDAIWVECVGERIEWEGKPAVLYFSSNVTERKNGERDRQKYEQYLQQAQKLESLGILAGGIAHDFNNILMGVFGFTDLARREVKDEVVSEYLSQAMESMERAKALTQQLLTFSKGGTPVRKKVSLSALVRETCLFSLHGSNVSCTFDLPSDLWSCNVDRNQIAQVIQNLMINSIQAMPMGGTITVSADNTVVQEGESPTLKSGSYVHLSIQDQGIGISEEMLPRVFDPFFTTKTQGHGLGLATSYSIVNRHEGAISVQSTLGRGTTFHIHLPACGEPGAENAPPSPVGHTGTGRILVMDDDEPVRRLIARMLHSFGYTVVCRENGTDTLETFVEETKNNRPFVAMILDLTIPGGMGGKEVAEKIRALDKGIPLFVSSGYAGDPIVAHPLDYGFNASISKPYRIAELMEVLEKHLGT